MQAGEIRRWSLGLLLILRTEFLAVGENHLQKKSNRRSIFCWIENNGDLISRLEAVLGPALVNQLPGTEGLSAPVRDVAFVVFDIQKDLGMRIRPEELGDGSLDRDSRSLIVGRSSMMCECRSACR